MMFNDEIYNNGGRPYFDFWWNGGIHNSSVHSNERKGDFFCFCFFMELWKKKKKKQPIRTLQFAWKQLILDYDSINEGLFRKNSNPHPTESSVFQLCTCCKLYNDRRMGIKEKMLVNTNFFFILQGFEKVLSQGTFLDIDLVNFKRISLYLF